MGVLGNSILLVLHLDRSGVGGPGCGAEGVDAGSRGLPITR